MDSNALTALVQSSSLQSATSFNDLNLKGYYQQDKISVLLPAPSAICVLGDLITGAVSGTDFLLKAPVGGFKYVKVPDNSTTKDQIGSFAAILQIALECVRAIQNSHILLQSISIDCGAILAAMEGIIKKTPQLVGPHANPVLLKVFPERLVKLQGSVASCANKASQAFDGFDKLRSLVNEVNQSMSNARAEAGYALKETNLNIVALKTKADSEAKMKIESEEYMANVQATYTKNRGAYEQSIIDIPDGSEVVRQNELEDHAAGLNFSLTLMMAYVKEDPQLVLQAFEGILKRYKQGEELGKIDVSLEPEPASDPEPSNHSPAVNSLKADALALLKLTTGGPDKSVDWEEVGNVESDPLGTIRASMKVTILGLRDAISADKDDSCQGIISLLEFGVTICDELDLIKLLKPADRVTQLIKSSEELVTSSMALAAKDVMKSHITPLDALPDVKVPADQPQSADSESDKKGSTFKHIGTLGHEQKIAEMHVKRRQLVLSRKAYDGGISDYMEIADQLRVSTSELARQGVLAKQHDQVLRSLALPLQALSMIQKAFSGLNALFATTNILVGQSMKTAFEDLKETLKVASSHKRSCLLTWTQLAMIQQATTAAKLVHVIRDVAKLYDIVYENSVKKGVHLIIDMIDLKADGVEKAKQSLSEWASDAHKEIQKTLAQDRSDFLAEIDGRVAQLDALAFPSETGSTLAGAVSQGIDRAEEEYLKEEIAKRERQRALMDW